MAKDRITFRNVKGTPLTFTENDDNFDGLMYYSGDWAAGAYSAQEVVKYLGVAWIAKIDTSETPGPSAVDWEPLGAQSAFGWGALRINSGKPYGTITATWRALNLWDELYVPNVNCVMNADGTFTFAEAGWWSLYFSMTVSHDESNGARTLGFRVFNVPDAVGGAVTQFGVARNQSVSNWTINPWVQVPSANLGKTYRMEIQRFNGQDFNSWTPSHMEIRLELKG